MKTDFKIGERVYWFDVSDDSVRNYRAYRMGGTITDITNNPFCPIQCCPIGGCSRAVSTDHIFHTVQERDAALIVYLDKLLASFKRRIAECKRERF